MLPSFPTQMYACRITLVRPAVASSATNGISHLPRQHQRSLVDIDGIPAGHGRTSNPTVVLWHSDMHWGSTVHEEAGHFCEWPDHTLLTPVVGYIFILGYAFFYKVWCTHQYLQNEVLHKSVAWSWFFHIRKYGRRPASTKKARVRPLKIIEILFFFNGHDFYTQTYHNRPGEQWFSKKVYFWATLIRTDIYTAVHA